MDGKQVLLNLRLLKKLGSLLIVSLSRCFIRTAFRFAQPRSVCADEPPGII